MENQQPGTGERWNRFTADIAEALMQEGVVSALQRAELYSVDRGEVPTYMDGAAAFLLDSHDEAVRERGFEYFAMQAEIDPSPIYASYVALVANNFGMESPDPRTAKRCYGIALSHLRNVAQQDNFFPDDTFIENLEHVASLIEEAGYDDLYHDTYAEFGPYIVVAAMACTDRLEFTEDNRVYGRFSLSTYTALEFTAIELYESDPDFARFAYDQIPEFLSKEYVDVQIAGRKLHAAFEAEDFTAARDLLRKNASIAYTKIWKSMVQKYEADPANAVWSDMVFETLMQEHGWYFQGLQKVDDVEGRAFGLAIGLAGRTDMLSAVINEKHKEDDCGVTALCAAHGFGVSGNRRGFVYLKRQTRHFSDDLQAELAQAYEEGRAAAASA